MIDLNTITQTPRIRVQLHSGTHKDWTDIDFSHAVPDSTVNDAHVWWGLNDLGSVQLEWNENSAKTSAVVPPDPLDLLYRITVEIGRVHLSDAEIFSLGCGSVIPFNKDISEPLCIFAENKLIARGEAVVIDENFGIRITETADQKKDAGIEISGGASLLGTRLMDSKPTELRAVLGRTVRKGSEIAAAEAGTVFVLDSIAGTPFLAEADGIPLFRADVIVIDGTFNLRIREIIAPPETQPAAASLGSAGKVTAVTGTAVPSSAGTQPAAQNTMPVQSAGMTSLADVQPDLLFPLIKNEYPQTIALILTCIPPETAAAVLNRLDADLQADISQRIAKLNRVNPIYMREVERSLEAKLGKGLIQQETLQPSGIEMLNTILSKSNAVSQRFIIETIEEEDPELADEIQKSSRVFPDIMMLDDLLIQKVLREVNEQTLVFALRGSDENIQNAFFRNMSKDTRDSIKKQIQDIGLVRLQTIEDARQKIAEIISRLRQP